MSLSDFFAPNGTAQSDRTRASNDADVKAARTFSHRSALALAEAIIPGSSQIPAADEATVAGALDLVKSFDPRLEKAWNAAQAALSTAAIAATTKPFHDLTAREQEALLHKWEHDGVMRTWLNLVAMIYKFAHFDRPSVYGEMGGKLNVVPTLEQPRWLRQIIPGVEVLENVECEVVVIGTGAGGAVVGRELADRGHAVVFVEEGEHHRRDSFDGSSVRAHQRFYRAAFSVGNAIIPIFMGRLVGGSTAINGGTCFRTPSWVLDRWCESLGSDEFSASAMDPYFARVEHMLSVAPSEPSTIGPIQGVMARGCDALNWHHFPLNRNAPGCDGSGFCDFGCRTDARRATSLSYVPPALEKGAMLLTGLTVEEIIVEQGAARGVIAKTKDGRRVRVRSNAVVLSGGAVPTPLLLLKQGICNASGQVGKNLTLHPSTGFSALFDEEIRGAKHVPQGYGCDEFQREGIMVLTAQPDKNIAWVLFPHNGRKLMETLSHLDHIASFALMVYDSSRNGRVWRDALGLPAITYNLQPADLERMHRAMVLTGEMCFAAGAKALYPVKFGTSSITTQKEFDAFKSTPLRASDVAWTSYHPLGTVQMGKDPRTSVVDLEHESHEIDRLFVVDASTVPGPLGVNPQITIMALATRAAQKIAERL